MIFYFFHDQNLGQYLSLKRTGISLRNSPDFMGLGVTPPGGFFKDSAPGPQLEVNKMIKLI
jgi:hypothetical protein